MLTITLDDFEIEKKFLEYSKEKKESIEDIVVKALDQFFNNESKMEYEKKDPKRHMKKISYEIDEDVDDVVPYSHIKESARYIHDLRRKKR